MKKNWRRPAKDGDCNNCLENDPKFKKQNIIIKLRGTSRQISPFRFFQPGKMKGILKTVKDFPHFDEKIGRACMSMIIANFQVQNTLRAYGQQLADRGRFSKAKAPKTALPKDEVSLSAESKKKSMTDRIAREMVSQFTQGPELNETGRKILQRLSREYGHSLTPEWREGEGLVFRVDQGKTPEEGEVLPPAETGRLKDSLFDIARSIVYSNLG